MYVTLQKLVSKPCTIFTHLLSSSHDVKVIRLFKFFFEMTYRSHNIF